MLLAWSLCPKWDSGSPLKQKQEKCKLDDLQQWLLTSECDEMYEEFSQNDVHSPTVVSFHAEFQKVHRALGANQKNLQTKDAQTFQKYFLRGVLALL